MRAAYSALPQTSFHGVTMATVVVFVVCGATSAAPLEVLLTEVGFWAIAVIVYRWEKVNEKATGRVELEGQPLISANRTVAVTESFRRPIFQNSEFNSSETALASSTGGNSFDGSR